MIKTDFDRKIELQERRIRDLHPLLKEAGDNLLASIAVHLAEVWRKRAQEFVRRHPEHTKLLNETEPDVLKRTKSAVNTLAANARTESEKRLVDEQTENWPHLTDWDGVSAAPFIGGSSNYRHSEFRIYGSPTPRHLAGAFNMLADEVSPILYDAGYPRASHHSPALHWSPGMRRALEHYADLHEELMEAQTELHRTHVAKQEAEATDLWDAA